MCKNLYAMFNDKFLNIRILRPKFNYYFGCKNTLYPSPPPPVYKHKTGTYGIPSFYSI